MTTGGDMVPCAEIEQRLRRLEQYVEVLEGMVRDLAAVRGCEYLDILTLKALALRHELTTPEELQEIEHELTAGLAINALLDGPIASRLTLVRELEQRLVTARADAE